MFDIVEDNSVSVDYEGCGMSFSQVFMHMYLLLSIYW